MEAKRSGYARVSTYNQNLALQQETLDENGCARIYTAQLSDSARDRPGVM